jgi:hypothetical protein
MSLYSSFHYGLYVNPLLISEFLDFFLNEKKEEGAIK